MRREGFDTLPREIQANIFSYIPHDEYRSVRLVNRLFNDISYDKSLWKKVSVHHIVQHWNDWNYWNLCCQFFAGGLGVSTQHSADSATGERSIPIHLVERCRRRAEDHWLHPRPCRRPRGSSSNRLLPRTQFFQGSSYAEDCVFSASGGDPSVLTRTENAHHQELLLQC